MTLPEQRNHLPPLRMPCRGLFLQNGGRAERQQSHQGSHCRTPRLPVRKPQQIIEKSILLIPHLIMVIADSIHRIGDPYEMLEELEGDILIHGVVVAKDQ